MKKLFLTCLFLIISFINYATDYTINSVDEFNDLNLSAGDTVTWADGTYSSDERIKFIGTGTASNPIILKSETPGGVIFTGGLQMDIAGSYLIVDGFYWNGGYGASNFIQFRSGETYAQNCTIQNCAINGLGVNPDDLEAGTSVKHRWIVLYGNYNNVLNCSFMDKSSAGALVLVELEYNAEANRCTEVGHTISNNYFYKYDKIDTSLTNAGDSETIRVGTSEFQNVNCATTVSNNYFVEADGENEIITNKSMNNTYVNNTFRRCRGSLVLRHGAGATIQGNIFLGENVDGTGGIRIVDSDHTITNNYIQDCITIIEQAKWNNGITFMGGGDTSVTDCSSTSVSNGYQKSENITLSNNTIVNTNAPLFYNGDKGTNDITGTVANNLIYFDNNSSNTTDVISGDASNSFSSFGATLSYNGNVYNNTNLGETASGFTSSSLTASSNREIYTISGASGKGADLNGYKPTTDSMVGDSIGACFLSAEGNSQTDCDGTTTPTDSLTVGSLNEFDATGGSQTLTVSANISWTASENTSWVSVNNNSGSNNGSVSITTTENTSTSNRSATITISGSGISRSITIIQAGSKDTTPSITFTPDTNKTYYIDSPVHNLRLAATGESEDAYTTTTTTTGDDVKWVFIAKGNGYWHLQRAAGGTIPRLRSDNSENADMNATSSNGTFTYYEITEGASDNTYFFTLPDGPTNYHRLQVNNSGDIKMVTDASDGTWESFSITEVDEDTTPSNDNLALDGTASQSTTAYNGEATRANDGNTNGSYSGTSVTHTSATTGSWWQVELNSQTNIGNIIIYNRTDTCCIERLSDFTVTVYDSNNNEVFSQNITEAPTPSTTINAGGALGNRVRITNNLNNTPLSLAEVEIYEGEVTTIPTTSCTSGTNLAENGTVVDFSTEQNTTNTVANLIDDIDNNRWSAETFPQYATVDLGDEYAINEINLVTFNDRDYQFTVKGSTSSATSGFSTIVDATNNTDEGTINRTFSSQSVRYVKLTITGANTYTGDWASIVDFKIICAGTTSSKISNKNVITDTNVFPNPFTNKININTGTNDIFIIKLVDMVGNTIKEQTMNTGTSIDNLNNLANGIYFLQTININTQAIKTLKLIKK